MESGAVIRSAGTVGILQDHASFLPETEPRMKGWALGYTDDWAVTLRVEDPGARVGEVHSAVGENACLIMKPGKAQGWMIQAFTGTTPGRWSLGGVLGGMGGGILDRSTSKV